jgi:hypothetical protein
VLLCLANSCEAFRAPPTYTFQGTNVQKEEVSIHQSPFFLKSQSLQGRLPLDNEAIDQAVEVGLTDCLRQLQKSNPTLLLTTSQLRVVERDYRYVPAISEALARMVVNCSDPAQHEDLLGTISRWAVPQVDHHKPKYPSITDLSRDTNNDDASTNCHGTSSEDMSLATTKALIESRLSLALSKAGTKKKPKSAAQSKRLRKDGLGKSLHENDDPNRVLDRCTRWADLFEDMQGSDASATEGSAQALQTGEPAQVYQGDNDDDWL